jgi:cyclic pyranopterin phosphate synthase
MSQPDPEQRSSPPDPRNVFARSTGKPASGDSADPEAGELTHLDSSGRARMVDVGGKPATERRARARALVRLSPQSAARVQAGEAPKGDVLGVARIAGIQAAKRTAELVPLCHPLALTFVGVEGRVEAERGEIELVAEARTTGSTGVEMEAMTAAAVAALTVYDMVKGIERGARIAEVELLEKSGGRSGEWRAPPARARDPRGRRDL